MKKPQVEPAVRLGGVSSFFTLSYGCQRFLCAVLFAAASPKNHLSARRAAPAV
jgi:hypothetical protein